MLHCKPIAQFVFQPFGGVQFEGTYLVHIHGSDVSPIS